MWSPSPDGGAIIAHYFPRCNTSNFSTRRIHSSFQPLNSRPAVEELPYDGVSELWFDSREAFDAAYSTDLGKRVASDSLQHVSGRLRLFVEEHIQVG